MNTTPSSLIVPTVHMNGTSGRDLLDQHCEAMSALSDAIDKLPHPNGRDYYVQEGDAIQAAMRQRERWAKAILAIHKEVEEIAGAISDAVSARETMRARRASA